MQAPGLLKDGYRVGQAIVRVLGDSTKTHEIHRVEEITGRPRYRQLQREMEATSEGRRLLAERPELSSDHVDYDHLRTLPESTLGGAYVHHLDSHGLSADYQAAATRHVDDPTMAYLMRRFRQTHDVWHALLGLGVEGYEEVLVHWFTFGQLKLPVSAMIMLFGSMKHIVLEQRWGAMRHSMMEAYRAGRDAEPLLPVYWEDHWEQPIEEIRARYNVRPLERRWLE
ncbi:MAG TPA: Coq4 family protein [Kofleriaceae bacterium]|nr:Coq4 family protein [Kofleriaceae bacterium]